MQVLNHKKIVQKIKRLSIQILERNYDAPQILLAGINNNGLNFAQLIHNELIAMSDKKIILTQIKINPANPIQDPIKIDFPLSEIHHNTIIVIDDVANTGRSLFYAIKPLLDIVPKKIETAVLVDRKHKSFPIDVNYYGISLATTLQENIKVKLSEKDNFSVELL
jgi:pyrimidine operon attenuation protein / uracil phosphoribosyltransferase